MTRISLRQLFAAVTLVALATVSLCYASALWESLVRGLVFISVAALLIVALVDRGRRQAFAIGMVIAATSYTAIVYFTPNRDNHHSGLPTTLLLLQLQNAVGRTIYYDSQTDQQLVGFTPPPTTIPNLDQGDTRYGRAISRASGIAGNLMFYEIKTPLAAHVLSVGHAWFALAFGYLGGRFAQYIYRARTSRHPTNAPSRP